MERQRPPVAARSLPSTAPVHLPPVVACSLPSVAPVHRPPLDFQGLGWKCHSLVVSQSTLNPSEQQALGLPALPSPSARAGGEAAASQRQRWCMMPAWLTPALPGYYRLSASLCPTERARAVAQRRSRRQHQEAQEPPHVVLVQVAGVACAHFVRLGCPPTLLPARIRPSQPQRALHSAPRTTGAAACTGSTRKGAAMKALCRP